MSGSTRALVLMAVLGGAVAGPAPEVQAQAARPAVRTIELVVGEQTTIPTRNVAKYSEGLEGVIDLKLPSKDATHFVVVALAPGQTSLLFIMQDGSQVRYNITVRPPTRPDQVEARDNIRLDFYFIELTRSAGYEVGLAWPGAGVGAGTLGASVDVAVDNDLRTGRTTSATATIASGVLPRLDLAQAAGWAKVMRHATVITQNGAPGTYTSGGEVNVRVASGTAVGVSQIVHGTKILVTPRYDKQSGRIEVKVAAEVATLGEAGPDGLPARNFTEVDTMVNLELGESVILAGLLARDQQKVSGGLPLLSQIPVLGYLFGVHRNSQSRAENVLLIVPTVVEAVSPARRARVEEALDLYHRFRGEFNHGVGPGRARPAVKRRAP